MKKIFKNKEAKQRAGSLLIIALLMMSILAGIFIYNADKVKALTLSTIHTLDLTGSPNDVEFSRNNTYVAIGIAYSGNVSVYNTSDWSLFKTLDDGHTSARRIDWSDTYMGVAYNGGQYRIYDATDGFSLVTTQRVHATANCPDIKFSNNNSYVAIACDDNNLYINNTSDWSSVDVLGNAGGDVQSVCFNSSDELMAFCSDDKDHKIFVYNWSTKAIQHTFDYGPHGYPKIVSFSNNDEWLSIGNIDGNHTIVSTSDWSTVHEFTTTGGSYEGAFSNDSSYFAYSDKNAPNVTIVWTSNWTTNVVIPSNYFTTDVTGIDFSNNGNYIAVGSRGGNNATVIELSYAGEGNTAPTNSNPSPSDGATCVNYNPTLNITVNDPDGN